MLRHFPYVAAVTVTFATGAVTSLVRGAGVAVPPAPHVAVPVEVNASLGAAEAPAVARAGAHALPSSVLPTPPTGASSAATGTFGFGLGFDLTQRPSTVGFYGSFGAGQAGQADFLLSGGFSTPR